MQLLCPNLVPTSLDAQSPALFCIETMPAATAVSAHLLPCNLCAGSAYRVQAPMTDKPGCMLQGQIDYPSFTKVSELVLIPFALAILLMMFIFRFGAFFVGKPQLCPKLAQVWK